MSSFAGLLKAARERAGLSQQKLAEQVGVDHSYISKIERGGTPPVRDKVVGLADALGITEKAERAAFLLAAGCASFEDLVAITTVAPRAGRSTALPSTVYHTPLSIPIEEILMRRLEGLEKKLRDATEEACELRALLEELFSEGRK